MQPDIPRDMPARAGAPKPMKKRVLIFPAGMPGSLAFLERALSEGQPVIGSSSLGHDPAREKYPLWVHLPYVTADDFDEALRKAVAEFDIGAVFTPNSVVWHYLNRVIPQAFPDLTLVNAAPLDAELVPYRAALRFARDVAGQGRGFAVAEALRPQASELEIAAMFRHAESIPGMCDHFKIRGLCEAFRHAPPGDVVEIGSWRGKSAFVLLRLAQIHGIGKVLCVDPWSAEHLVQNDAKGLVDALIPTADLDETLTVFQLNLLPYARGDLNYLRMPSVEAAEVYRRGEAVESAAFGTTRYQRRIAVLHIDGNHSYDSARADITAWSDLVLPGGWIVVDDYVWPYGDGPQRAGDELIAGLLETHPDGVDLAFVTGSALFIRLKPDV